MKKLTIDEVKQRIKGVYGDTVTLDETTYISTHTKCRFIDTKYGEFFARPYYVFKNHGHIKRGNEKHKEAMKNRITPLDDVKKQLFAIHGKIIMIDGSTYHGTHKKARFIDIEHGAWWARPNSVLAHKTGHKNRSLEKSKKTCMEKYGVEHHFQNPAIALKAARTANKIIENIHWKTNETLYCHGSWELKVTEYFNNNKIDFKWQHKVFTMPDKRTYRPDCYITKDNLWIEIKGYFWEDAEEKWKWFHKEKIKLRAMG